DEREEQPPSSDRAGATADPGNDGGERGDEQPAADIHQPPRVEQGAGEYEGIAREPENELHPDPDRARKRGGQQGPAGREPAGSYTRDEHEVGCRPTGRSGGGMRGDR